MRKRLAKSKRIEKGNTINYYSKDTQNNHINIRQSRFQGIEYDNRCRGILKMIRESVHHEDIDISTVLVVIFKNFFSLIDRTIKQGIW